jgi:hypothetical protein
MTPAEFRAWLDRMGWGEVVNGRRIGTLAAARALGVSRSKIFEWSQDRDAPTKRSDVPRYIAKLCQALERLRELEC